jgi:hypothetical protein
MAPPLCLPRSIQAHNDMIVCLEALINKQLGTLVGPVTIIDNPKDDAQAKFCFKFQVRNGNGNIFPVTGSLTAMWTNPHHNGKPTPIETYVAAEVCGEGWRIFLDESDWGGPTDE